MSVRNTSALMGSAARQFGSGLLQTNRMRPYIDRNGEARIAVGNGRSIRTNAPAMLQYDEWKDIDRTVTEIATDRLVGIAALMSKGLVHSLGSIGLTVSLWETTSDMTPAQVSMSGVSRSQKDAVQFESQQVPVPVIHKDFTVNVRRLEASRILGEGIDTIQAGIATRKVAESSEDMLFAGHPTKVDGSTIYGYTNHPDRNPVDMAKKWTGVGKATGLEIVADVQAMLAAARADHFYGPFSLYVPGDYEGRLDDDYDPTTGDTRTIRERIMQLGGIGEIVVADRLSDHNVVLVQMTSDVVDLAVAQDITTVQWQEMGGLIQEYHVMAVWVPRLKSDFNGHMGVVHLYEIE
jgi:uncharacterized linocin/CFP29 family protein